MNEDNCYNPVYDVKDKKEMEDFLFFVYNLMLENNKIDYYSIYSLLSFYNLPSYDKDDSNKGLNMHRFFDRWENRYKNKKTETYYDESNPYWFLLSNALGNKNKYIKLYVPINSIHLFEGVNLLFDYLEEENIRHDSKISDEIRTDNIIIRLAEWDYKSANKIIEFINNNKYLKTGLNKTNPFVPTSKGIGIISEAGGSYNKTISSLIEGYLSMCIQNNNEPSIDEFREFLIMSLSNNNINEYVLNIFDNVYQNDKSSQIKR